MAAAAKPKPTNGKAGTDKFLLTKEAKDVFAILKKEGADRKPIKTASLQGRINVEGYAELRKHGDLIIKTTGRGRGALIQIIAKDEQISEETAPSRVITKRTPRGSKNGATNGVTNPARGRGVLTIGASEKAYIREHVREYLEFATSVNARNHELRRQSDDILDAINSRAKEILKASKSGDGPRLTPLEAARQAQAEVAMDFETLLVSKWRPIMFEIFGMDETGDTDMKMMRSN